MRIAVDAMGGDLGPGVVVRGALRALPALPPTAHLLLVGDAASIGAELGAAARDRVEIVHAPDVVSMDEAPAAAVRRKPNASMVVAARLVQERAADAMISPGNSGGVLAAALFTMGRLATVQRPALATVFPTSGGDCVLLDVGANADCKAQHLVQFAVMGSAFARARLGRERPRVGLLNIGEEPSKGNEVVAATYPLLRDSGLEFVGNVEGRDLLAGNADVVVCDGFVGNIVLKFTESMLGFTRALLRAEIERSWRLKLGHLAMRPAFAALKRRLDYQEFGGAPLLGVAGVVVIAHGKSSERAIENAVLSCRTLVDHRIVESIDNEMQQIGGAAVEDNGQRTDRRDG